MVSKISCKFAPLLASFWATTVAKPARSVRGPKSLDMVFTNPYSKARELYWISPSGGHLNLMGSINGSYGEMRLTTYDGHVFGWRVLPPSPQIAHPRYRRPVVESEECSIDELEGRVTMHRRVSRYTLGEQMVVPEEESERMDAFDCWFVNRSPRSMKITRADESRDILTGDSEVLSVRRGETVDWSDLVTGELLFRSVIEKYGQTPHVYREEMYTTLCASETPATPALREVTYEDQLSGRSIEVKVLREDPWIVLLKNWTTYDECASLEEQALKTGLSGAQVFGENAIIADRRALSANVYWDSRNESSINNRLIRRAFTLAQVQRGYKVEPGPAQEPLNFIQYAYADEYRPHCDGVCHRTRYARGGRVATLIHYCKAPVEGGATVFPKIKTKVVPRDNDALFFAYKRDDGFMDSGNTLHTGCLVKTGPKQIVTMWMREDVHPGEPWSDFLS